MNSSRNRDNDVRRVIDKIDSLIRDHFRSSDGGAAEAVVSVNDKWSWAKSLHVDLELIEARLDKLCHPAAPRDEYEIVPRYRLKHP